MTQRETTCCLFTVERLPVQRETSTPCSNHCFEHQHFACKESIFPLCRSKTTPFFLQRKFFIFFFHTIIFPQNVHIFTSYQGGSMLTFLYIYFVRHRQDWYFRRIGIFCQECLSATSGTACQFDTMAISKLFSESFQMFFNHFRSPSGNWFKNKNVRTRKVGVKTEKLCHYSVLVDWFATFWCVCRSWENVILS